MTNEELCEKAQEEENLVATLQAKTPIYIVCILFMRKASFYL